MISEIWTLQAASGGPVKTLAEWGFERASFERLNQDIDTLTLSGGVADAVGADDLWEWEQEVILFRDGSVYFRGYLAESPRTLSPKSEAMAYVFKNIWWLMEETTYLHPWTALTGTTTGTVNTGRVRLGDDPETRDAASMLEALATYAATVDVPLTWDTSALAVTRPVPRIEAHNRTLADLARQILRWHPDVAVVADYDETGTTLRLAPAGTAATLTLDVGGAPAESIDIRTIPGQQVDSVHVLYETTAPRYEFNAGTGETNGFAAATTLVVAQDVWPAASPVTRRSLVLTMPYPATPESGGTLVPAKPQWTYQPVEVETYPTDGATGSTAQAWWFKRSGLIALGLTAADVRIPSTDSDTVRKHRVTLDPDFLQNPPSAVNPSGTPLWAPTTVADVPRELLSGALHDWMRVKSAPVIATVSLGVLPSAVNALTSSQKAAFMRLGPRQVNFGGTGYYVLDATYRIPATDAVEKTYAKLVSIDWGGITTSGEASTATGASYTAAVEAAVVPNLARRLYEARSAIPYAGSVPMVYEDVPLASAVGRLLSLVHPDRPAWATMRAVIQSESIDIGEGTRSVTFGPPKHLSPQDWADLHRAAREARDQRGVDAPAPQPASNGDIAPIEESEEAAGNLATFGPPIVGASITPTPAFRWEGGGVPALLPWSLEVVDGALGQVKIVNPGKLKRTAARDGSGRITITSVGATFTVVAGDYLSLEITDELAVTLKKTGENSGWPIPVDTEEAGTSGIWVMTKYWHDLWKFVSSSTDPNAVMINDTLYAERRTFRDAPYMQLFDVQLIDSGGHVVDAKQPFPCEADDDP